MKQHNQRRVEVWTHWVGLPQPALLGVLYAAPVRAKEIFSFEYDPAWLQNSQAQVLDPSLVLFAGPQYPPAEQANFGMFLDSSPDRWGRLSPAYDINPVPYADGLKLNISDVDNAQDLGLAREVAALFRVNSAQANQIIQEVVTAVKQWREVANSLKISSWEQDRMELAFRVAKAES